MPQKYRLSPEAYNDLLKIGIYTQKTFGKNKRKEYLLENDNSFMLIAQNSEIGKIRDGIKKGIRSLVVLKHIILYRIKNDVVEIIRIANQNEDYEYDLY